MVCTPSPYFHPNDMLIELMQIGTCSLSVSKSFFSFHCVLFWFWMFHKDLRWRVGKRRTNTGMKEGTSGINLLYTRIRGKQLLALRDWGVLRNIEMCLSVVEGLTVPVHVHVHMLPVSTHFNKNLNSLQCYYEGTPVKFPCLGAVGR